MEQKRRKLLEEKARHLSPKWMETGIKRTNERFFGLLSKRQMSMILIAILLLSIITDIGIFSLLYLNK